VLRLITIDFRLIFLFVDEAETIDLCIETTFTMTGNAEDFVCVPEDPKSLAPILPLVNSKVDSIAVRGSGQLAVYFSSGVLIKVTPDPSYEAWQLGASSGFLMVCPPEGKVVIFQNKADLPSHP
jgi:hypothetical protein